MLFLKARELSVKFTPAVVRLEPESPVMPAPVRSEILLEARPVVSRGMVVPLMMALAVPLAATVSALVSILTVPSNWASGTKVAPDAGA